MSPLLQAQRFELRSSVFQRSSFITRPPLWPLVFLIDKFLLIPCNIFIFIFVYDENYKHFSTYSLSSPYFTHGIFCEIEIMNVKYSILLIFTFMISVLKILLIISFLSSSGTRPFRSTVWASLYTDNCDLSFFFSHSRITKGLTGPLCLIDRHIPQRHL